ncbi:MAG: GntR family transcriptional regulator [Leptolinea sp.]
MHIIRQKSIADQTQEILRTRICEQYYGASNRLPSEDMLAAELGVSRATMRMALAGLASERLVIRKQGDGTFINKHFTNSTIRFDTIWEFSNLIEQSGRNCSIRSMGFFKRFPTKDEMEILGISESDMVISIDRLFLADNKPVILSNNVVPIRLMCQEITQDDIVHPIREFFEKNCSQTLVYALSDIIAVIPPPHVANLLNLSQGSPVLKFVEVFFDEQNDPLVVAQNFYDTNDLRLRIPRSFT